MFNFLKRWFPKPLTSNEETIVTYIQEHAILFGSRDYNVATPNSDYDYFFYVSEYAKFLILLSGFRIKYKGIPIYHSAIGIFDGIEFTLSDGRTFQVVCFGSLESYNSIVETNDLMKLLCKSIDFSNREYRHQAFTTCRNFIRFSDTTQLLPEIRTFLQQFNPELLI